MQWDLLVPNLGDPEKLALVKENVELISSGSSPHCAGTLKLGIRKAVKLEKEKRNPPGVLRCTNSRFCSWRGDPSSVNYCQVCANARAGVLTILNALAVDTSGRGRRLSATVVERSSYSWTGQYNWSVCFAHLVHVDGTATRSAHDLLAERSHGVDQSEITGSGWRSMCKQTQVSRSRCQLAADRCHSQEVQFRFGLAMIWWPCLLYNLRGLQQMNGKIGSEII